MTTGRFDYIKYDEKATRNQNDFKLLFRGMEAAVEEFLPRGRAQALVLTKLEEAYMWVGKAIRDEQITRANSPDLPERSEG